jgi:hypothetical protein
MPQIRFTDTNLKTLSADATTWFSDPSVKGLRLCVTAGGTKTWYANRWDPTVQKVRQVKLGQWTPQGKHCAWAKKEVARVGTSIEDGAVLTKKEEAAKEAKEQAEKPSALPTLGEALDQMIAHKSNPGRETISRKRPMSKTTVTNYRSSFRRYLSKWANVPVDALPIFEISSHLDTLQVTKPQAAQRAAGVVSAVVNHVAKVAKQDLKAPGLTDPTATRSRAAEGGDIDMTIPLSARWTDIQSVQDPILRAVMEITVYTGLRARPLLELTWDRVYQVEVQGGLAWAINLDKPVKHQLEDREVVLGDDAGRIIERLRALRVDGCPWVFPSTKCDAAGRRVHLFSIPTVGQTTGNTARHYWMPIARTHLSLASMKWLALHSLKGEGLGMAGHYGKPTHQEQYEAANVIGSKINALLAIKVSPANVVEMGRVRA